MPVVRTSDKHSGCVNAVVWGCGVCIVLGIVLCIAGYFAMNYAFKRMLTWTVSPTPVRRSAPYVYTYNSDSAHCSITLPDERGKLTYSHLLNNSRNAYWGVRGIKVMDKAGISQEWPLPYSPLSGVKVGVYWYSAKNGQGPFLRFYDATGNSILDFKKREIGQFTVVNGRSLVANYAYNNTEFHSGGISTTNGKPSGLIDAYGQPGRDVSKVVNPSNCNHLGSIIRKGDQLIFQPKAGRGKVNP